MRAWAGASSLAVLLACGAALAQQRDDDESELLVRDARAEVAAHKYDQAAGELDRALAVNPRRLDAYILRASVHSVKKEYPQAVAVMRRAQALAPDSVDVLSALGSALVLAGDEAEGVAVLEKVAAQAPERYQAHATLGNHYATHGRPRDAARELEAYLATRPAALSGEDGSFKVTLADAELRSGRAADARKLFVAVEAADPENLRARLGAAWAAAAVDCAEAQPLLDALLPLAPRFPDILVVAGRCRLETGHAADARALAERYLTVKPSAAGHALRGEALLAGGSPAEARRELEEAIANEPENPRHVLRLARAMRLAGDPRGAAARLATGSTPEAEPDWSTERAEALLAVGQSADAVAALAPAADAHPADVPAHVVLGAALFATGQTEAALRALEPTVSASTRGRGLYVRALVKTGVTSAKAGRLEEAQRALVKAVAADSGNTAALVDLGAVRLAMRDPAGAAEPLERAARAGKSAPALILYGRALALTGHPQQAQITLEAAIPLVAGDPARSADLTIELAAAELDGGDARKAAALLETALAGNVLAAGRQRLEEAYLVAARAAAARALTESNPAGAVRLLERAEKLAVTRRDVLPAIRCEIALAATGAGERDVALARLRLLRGATCPFPKPADELAVPVLELANSDANHVEGALAKLMHLARQAAAGPAATLVSEVARSLAARAAADAFARGHADRARRLLAVAAQLGAATPELSYDQAILELDAGRTDAAIAALSRLTLPEAQVGLGLAWERKGEPARALEALLKAQDLGVKVDGLADWIAAKQRIYGGGTP